MQHALRTRAVTFAEFYQSSTKDFLMAFISRLEFDFVLRLLSVCFLTQHAAFTQGNGEIMEEIVDDNGDTVPAQTGRIPGSIIRVILYGQQVLEFCFARCGFLETNMKVNVQEIILVNPKPQFSDKKTAAGFFNHFSSKK